MLAHLTIKNENHPIREPCRPRKKKKKKKKNPL